MLLYSTVLDTQPTLDADSFIALVIKCIQENEYPENRVPGIDWKPGVRNAKYGISRLSLTIREYGDDSRDSKMQRTPVGPRGKNKGARKKIGQQRRESYGADEMKRRQFSVFLRRSHIIAIRQEKVSNGVHWFSDYIFNLTLQRLAIELSRTYRRGASPEDDFSAPMLISYLEDGGYLSDDLAFPMSRRPLDLDEATARQREGFVRAIRNLERVEYPIVYVPRNGAGAANSAVDNPIDSAESTDTTDSSKGADTTGIAIDAKHLASQLKGLVHVVIGPTDREACEQLARECKRDPAQDSPVVVYWPTVDGVPMIFDKCTIPRHVAPEAVDEALRLAVRRNIVQRSRIKELPDEYTWDGVNQLILNAKADEIQKNYETASSHNQTLQARLSKLAKQHAENAEAQHTVAEQAEQLQHLQQQLDEAQSQISEQKQQNLAKDEKLRKINAEKRFENNVEHDLRRQHQQETQAFQDLLAEQEQRNAELQRQSQQELEDLRNRIAELETQNRQLRQENNQLTNMAYSGGKQTLLTYGDETDVFDGEVRDYVLEAIDTVLRGLPQDPTSHLRQADVLADILRTNGYRELHKQRREQIRNLIPLFAKPGPELFKELEKLGFRLVRGDNHYVIEYGGDQRYRSAMSKTPSDVRTGENGAAALCRHTQ